MNATIEAGLFLMAAGMGTVFLSLAVFFAIIVLFEKVFKNKEKTEE